MHEKIEKALQKLQPALAADGFVLRLESVNSDGSVSVALDATSDACMDCLIPDHVLVSILERAVREEEPSVRRIVLNKHFQGGPEQRGNSRDHERDRPATSPDNSLRSTPYEVADAFAANELFHQNGWTDGLPIVPPTETLTRACLDYVGLMAGDVVGIEPVRQRRLTAEKVAINATMAGCVPAYMPVVLAVVRAMCAPEFNLHGCTASTGGSAPFIVVNGPIRREIGMRGTHNALANGSRANAVIGRAVRLIIINVLGGVPGQLDRSTLGHPGKYTFCVAEDEEDSPWRPLAQERGVRAGVSAVTVMAAGSPHQVMNEWTADPREVLETFAAAIRVNMLTYSIWAGNYAIIIPKQLRTCIARAGWQKSDIREFVFQSARVVRRDWRGAGKAAVAARRDENQELTALRSPDDLLVVAAGGPAGGFGAVIPPWYGNKSLAVTEPLPTAVAEAQTGPNDA